MNNNPKSATVAGLLGIFLGGAGAHNWYLGEKKKGIIHVCLLGGAILLMVVADAILPSTLSMRTALSMAGLILLLNAVAGMMISGSSLWGFIEGVMILAKGDAGLAQRGRLVPGTSGFGVPVVQQPMAQDAAVQQNWQAGTNYAAGGEVAGLAGDSQSQLVGGAVRGAGGPVIAKQPMDPVKKKRIIRGVVFGVAVIVVLTVGVVAVMVLTKVDYGEAYMVAKELKPEVSAVYQNTDCSRVIEYVDSTYLKPADYNKYTDNCLSAGSEIDGLLEKLGETAGVKRNKEIKAQFEKFSEGVNAVLPNREELEAKLGLYKAWHEYEYLRSDVEYTSPDSTVQATAAPLVNSGNATLKAYGEGWQASVLGVTQAYREYNNLSYSDPNKSSARVKYQDLLADHNNWVAENKPDIKQLGGLNFDNSAKMYSEWTKLYNLIRDAYKENYNRGSGDCSELFGEVYCD